MPRHSFPPFARPLLFMLLLGGCAAAPLADSPYQRIVKARPGAGPHLVQVSALPQSPPEAVVSPSEPEPEMIREAACEALAGTPFPCANPENPRERPQYHLQIAYYVRDMEPSRSPGLRILGMVGSGGRVFGDHDPPQDADHEIVWRFTLTRPGEGGPDFQSETFSEPIQYWRFDIQHWLGRYFSE
jgi:hypothetical protein